VQLRSRVAAEAGDCVLCSYDRAKSRSNLSQQSVTRRVPELIVDSLEAIEIEA
jgi:hypothetical protein